MYEVEVKNGGFIDELAKGLCSIHLYAVSPKLLLQDILMYSILKKILIYLPHIMVNHIAKTASHISPTVAYSMLLTKVFIFFGVSLDGE